MSETNGVGAGAAKSPRRVSPGTSIVMLLVGGLVWFFLTNLTELHYVLAFVIAAVLGGAAGLVAQEVVAHRRRR